MVANPGLVAVSSTAEIGKYTSTSDATVVRATKKLRYDSFRELRHAALDTSGRHRDPSKVLDDQLDQIRTAATTGAKRVLRDTADLVAELEGDFDAEAWDRATVAIAGAKRVVRFGIGPSGCVADYLSISLSRTGVRSASVKTTGFALADQLLDLDDADVLVMFATLRRFREVDVVLKHAAEVGATTILVTETLGEALRKHVDIVLATPPTTTRTSNGVIVGLVLAHALELSVASQHKGMAVQSVERLNALRSELVQGPLDADS